MLKIKYSSIQKSLILTVHDDLQSVTYVDEYDNYTKIIESNVPLQELCRKEEIVKSVYDLKLLAIRDIVPATYQLIYGDDGKFAGYSMEPASGKSISNHCKVIETSDIFIPEMLSLFENLQMAMKILHRYDICFTDLNPEKLILTKNYTIQFLDIDNLCRMNQPVEHIIRNHKYSCPFTKVFDINANIYSFYCFFLDILLKVNKINHSKDEIFEKIMEQNIFSNAIKDKLVYFLIIKDKRALLKLDYLF